MTPGGGTGNGQSHRHFISAVGQVVVFNSTATDLVPGDTNHQTDIFLNTP